MTLKKSKRFEFDVEKDTNGSPNHIEKSFGGGGGLKTKMSPLIKMHAL